MIEQWEKKDMYIAKNALNTLLCMFKDNIWF